MHWDGTITLGNILTISSMIIVAVLAYHNFVLRMAVQTEIVTRSLQAHSNQLARHAERLDRHEEHSLQIVADLQRVIGRVEVVQADRRFGTDRRSE